MFGFYLVERIYKEKTCKTCGWKFKIKGISAGKDNVTIIRLHEKLHCEVCGNKRKKELEKCQELILP